MYQTAIEKRITPKMMKKSFFDVFGENYKNGGKIIFLANENKNNDDIEFDFEKDDINQNEFLSYLKKKNVKEMAKIH